MNIRRDKHGNKTKHEPSSGFNRREFLKTAIKTGALATVPGSLLSYSQSMAQQVEIKHGSKKFTFAYISDSHLLDRGREHKFARALIRAVNDVNMLDPKPDFVLYGGDLACLRH